MVWESTVKDPVGLLFDSSNSGIRQNTDNMTPIQVFELIWTRDIMNLLLEKTNEYGESLCLQNRPKRRNERFRHFQPVGMQELKQFFGLCLIGGQLKCRSVRKLFSLDPIYYHPIFSATMSGRRFEQILRCLNCSNEDKNDTTGKVSLLMTKIIKNSQNLFYPQEALSLDESLLLFRGRLRFRVYIKNKKTRYGIKFYELCSSDGYILNIEMYKGKTNRDDVGSSKIDSLVLRLMEPYLNKGHHLYMDNFYNSVTLSNKLLVQKTHSTGTLRSNRSGNPQEVTKAKLQRGSHIWRRSNNIYVSKWRDKREVLAITTAYVPHLIETENRYGKKTTKPQEVMEYNNHMSGIDRSDQMISYYSCPKKTVRWYKKVIFHFLDIALWNAFYIYKYKLEKKPSFATFRESVIRELLGIAGKTDGREFVAAVPAKTRKRASRRGDQSNHILEAIPIPENSKRKGKFYKRCRQCSTEKKRKESAWQCNRCVGNPSLCVGTCFDNWHK